LNQNFDSIGEAMLTLFEISTTEGWVDVMYAGTDARGPFMQPLRDVQELWSIFFVLFIFVGSFFILNLCVGVILDNFNKIKSQGDEILMTNEQREWINARTALMRRQMFYPLINLHLQAPCRVKLYFFVSHQKFEVFIMACILLNTLVMAMKWFPTPSKEYEVTLGITNYIFAFVFATESALKIAALRTNYFRDGWNLFDFVCVIATFMGMAINLFTNIEIGSVMSAVRLFRIARLFRLVRYAKGLMRLFTAFVLSLPKLLNVAVILFLLLFLFSILGVQMFAKVKNDEDFDGSIGIHGNFHDTGRAFMLLVRSMTGEGWNELMHSLSKNDKWFVQVYGDKCYAQNLLEVTADTFSTLDEKCLIEYPNGCGSDFAYIFFIAYTCLITFVILNLVIAVILEGFDDSNENEDSNIVGKVMDLMRKYDPNCTLVVKLADVFKLIEELAKASEYTMLKKLQTPPILEHGANHAHMKLVDLGAIPMWIANSCTVEIDRDQNTHFIDAVNLTLVVILAQNHPAYFRELKKKELEASAGKSTTDYETLEKQQKKRQKYDLVMQNHPTDLAQEVASLKIQVVARGRRDRRRVQRLKSEAAQEKRNQTPPAAG
jgi:hypothetical protein